MSADDIYVQSQNPIICLMRTVVLSLNSENALCVLRLLYLVWLVRNEISAWLIDLALHSLHYRAIFERKYVEQINQKQNKRTTKMSLLFVRTVCLVGFVLFFLTSPLLVSALDIDLDQYQFSSATISFETWEWHSETVLVTDSSINLPTLSVIARDLPASLHMSFPLNYPRSFKLTLKVTPCSVPSNPKVLNLLGLLFPFHLPV